MIKIYSLEPGSDTKNEVKCICVQV